jgi:uncharacterized metal-binding protein
VANKEAQGCACAQAPKLIFPCSGAADVGAIADQAGRKLSREGAGNMYCLAGIGGRVPGIMKSAQVASAILVIDGCPIDCARKTLEQAGFTSFDHLQLADLGLRKGESPVTQAAVATVAGKGAEMLAAAGG